MINNWIVCRLKFLVTGAVLLVATGGGLPIGFSAVLLPQLSDKNSTLHVDRDTGSWIGKIAFHNFLFNEEVENRWFGRYYKKIFTK